MTEANSVLLTIQWPSSTDTAAAGSEPDCGVAGYDERQCASVPLRGPVLGPQPQHKKDQQPDADAYCPEAPGRELRPIHFPVIGEATLGDGPARVQREQQTNDDKSRQRCQDTIHRSPYPSYPSQVCLCHARLVPPAIDGAGSTAALRSQLEPFRCLQQHCRQKSLRERAKAPCLTEDSSLSARGSIA